MKIIVVLLVSCVALCAADSRDDAMANFSLLKQVNLSMGYTATQLKSAYYLQNDLKRLPVTPDTFIRVNTKFRDLLILVIENQNPSFMTKISNWIYNFRPVSLILNDVQVQVKKANELYYQLNTQAGYINTARSSALALPFDQKVKNVNDTLNRFVSNFPTMNMINEQLNGAVTDFKLYLEKI